MVRVTAAVIEKEGSILIAKRKKDDKLFNLWEFPGGKIEEGESPEECLKREIREELGVIISVGEYIGSSYYEYDHISIELMAYMAKWISGVFSPIAHDEIRWIKPKELDRYEFAPADIPIVRILKRRYGV